MMQRTLVGLGLVALGVVVLGAGRAREGSRSRSWGGAQAGGASVELYAAPLLRIRGAHDDVVVGRSDGPRVVVSVPGAVDLREGAFARRVEGEDGEIEVVVDVHPRRRVEVGVPHGTAVRLMFAKSRIDVHGVDDVDVRTAKSEVKLRDVGGTVRIRSAKDSVGVVLSGERETRAVDVLVAKSALSLELPAARGGAFSISSAKSSVTAPPSTEGGVPVELQAAKSNVVVRAA